MRNIYTLILLVLGIGTTPAFAQNETSISTPKKNCSCKFSSINQLGLAQGERPAAILAQTINGMRYGTWFAGLGVGVDTYKRTSIPVFLDIRKNLLNKVNTPFVYADGGYHFIANDKTTQYSLIYEYNGGLLYDMGVGYKFVMEGKQILLLSAGYSVKNMEQKEYYDRTEYCPACHDYTNKYSYRLNRYSFKIGFQF